VRDRGIFGALSEDRLDENKDEDDGATAGPLPYELRAWEGGDVRRLVSLAGELIFDRGTGTRLLLLEVENLDGDGSA
jgi:hypothetical protein